METTNTDIVIEDLIKWLKDNLPPDSKEEDIFKLVRRLQRIYDVILDTTFEEFYKFAKNIDGNSDQEQQSHQHQHPQQQYNSRVDSDDLQEPQKKKMRGDETVENTPRDVVSEKLEQIREYFILDEEKRNKTQQLNESRTKLELKKEQFQFIDSIKLDRCMDLMTRYHRLMAKK